MSLLTLVSTLSVVYGNCAIGPTLPFQDLNHFQSATKIELAIVYALFFRGTKQEEV